MSKEVSKTAIERASELRRGTYSNTLLVEEAYSRDPLMREVADQVWGYVDNLDNWYYQGKLFDKFDKVGNHSISLTDRIKDTFDAEMTLLTKNYKGKKVIEMRANRERCNNEWKTMINGKLDEYKGETEKWRVNNFWIESRYHIQAILDTSKLVAEVLRSYKRSSDAFDFENKFNFETLVNERAEWLLKGGDNAIQTNPVGDQWNKLLNLKMIKSARMSFGEFKILEGAELLPKNTDLIGIGLLGTFTPDAYPIIQLGNLPGNSMWR